MFKKSTKAKFRSRKKDDFEEESEENGHPGNGTQTKPLESNKTNLSSKKTKSKHKEPTRISLLSFDDEEESEVDLVRVKKSNRSKRIAKHIKKRAREEKNQTGNQNSELKTSDNLHPIHEFQPQSTDKVDKQQDFGSHDPKVPSFQSINQGAIPSSAMIHAARKQREMLRKFGSEYIPLEDTQTCKENSNSRLVREGDNDASSDEEVIEMKGV